ncbi:cilia- and flagella-associated protein 74 isoform X2 [Octopus bimaculoides]|uniref:cilia- and flagella-associated protein 74 isoform X2 n=1 Tax=Octopus bimaculoides TaxID=37653 RepID=UPI0022E53FCF|nr:cilia- and flagella-associated protein 74 isoform X2 [Octopus bimaculoides]
MDKVDKLDEERKEKNEVPEEELLKQIEILMPDVPNEVAHTDTLNKGEYTDIPNEVEYTKEGIGHISRDPQDVKEKAFHDLEQWGPESDDETLSLSSGASHISFEEDNEKDKSPEVQLNLHNYLELQRYLSLLDSNFERSQINLDQLWEEFKQCQERIFILNEEEEDAHLELEKAEASNENIPLINRLQKKYKRICEEIDLENNLKTKIREMLDDSRKSVVSAELRRNQFVRDKQFLLEDRDVLPNQAEKTQTNLYIEEQKAQRAKKTKEKILHDDIEEVKQEQMKIKETIEHSKEAYKKANKFLKETLSKIQESDEKNNEEYKAYMKQRMETVLKLKESIDASKTLRHTKKQQAVSERDTYEERETASERICSKITDMIRGKKEMAERQERELKRRQQENSCKIIEKILMEEKLRKKLMQKTKTPSSSLYMKQRKNVIPLLQKLNLLDAISDVEKPSPRLPKIDIKTSSIYEDETNLSVPEFDGLWKECDFLKKTNASLEEQTVFENRSTKENMKKTLSKADIPSDKSPETVTTAFHGKPDVIHFKDIEVGKSYRKRTVITNVSSNVNYIRYSHVTSKMKDFVDIEFHPPGLLSPGMACELFVTFKPLINQNITGEVNLETKTGTFQIFLKTSIKKCQLKINTSTVDFGQTVIEEIHKKSIHLENDGALGTNYTFISEKMFLKTKKDELISKESFGRSSDDQQSSSNIEQEESLDDMDEEDVDISVGKESSGYIGPYSSVKLEIVWHPKLPGPLRTNYIFSFSDSSLETIPVKLIGVATDILVQILQTSMDMKICVYDKLYQDTIILENRQPSAFKIKFDIDRRIRNHLEILPKMGIIQAKSQFLAQLKFLPRKSLTKDAPQFYDVNTSVFEMNIKIWIASYRKPIIFTVHAVVTSSDLQFNESSIDFGNCTIFESACRYVELYNKSLLPQQFAFLNIPSFVDVQPNDGFGTILPLESLTLEVVFQPSTAKEYEFDIVCKTLTNSEFPLKCKGLGIAPPLKLSHQVINFKGTALYDKSEATVYLSKYPDNQEMKSDSSHKGKHHSNTEIVSFEFVIPEDVPIAIFPCVGSVYDDELRVQVQFSPVLNEREIKEEAVAVVTAMLQKELHVKYQIHLKKVEEERQQSLRSSKSKTSKRMKSIDCISSPSGLKPRLTLQPCMESIKIDVSETLYLEVYCTTISPSIIVLSDNGKSEMNFGNICVGQSRMKSLTIQNISDDTIKLSTSVFNTNGPFLIKNSFPTLQPNDIHSLIISFSPSTGEEFYEVLQIKSALSCVYVKVTGVGIVPNLKFSFEGSIFDMGCINAGEFYNKTFTIQNLSPISIDFTIELASISDQYSKDTEWNIQPVNTVYKPLRQNFPHQPLKPFIGIQNYNGLNVFDLVPSSGQIAAGSTKEITITFAPDHTSKSFSDIVKINTFEKNCVHSFQVVGQGKGTSVFFDEHDKPVPAIESLSLSALSQMQDDTILVNLQSIFEQDKCSIVKKELSFGSIINTTSSSQKKGGEVSFEVTSDFTSKGFSVEPHKASLDSGSKKTVILTWNPPHGSKPGYSIKTILPCNMKGSDATVYPIKIYLCAVVLLNCTP